MVNSALLVFIGGYEVRFSGQKDRSSGLPWIAGGTLVEDHWEMIDVHLYHRELPDSDDPSGVRLVLARFLPRQDDASGKTGLSLVREPFLY